MLIPLGRPVGFPFAKMAFPVHSQWVGRQNVKRRVNLEVAGDRSVGQSSEFMVEYETRSLRLSRSEWERVMAALLVSLLLHLSLLSVYEMGQHWGWWKNLRLFALRHHIIHPVLPAKTAAQESPPTIFVDVSQADATPPKNTPYYSDKNSHAGNPDEDKNLKQPKLDGKQKDMLKTENATRLSKAHPAPNQAQPLRPSPDTPPTQPSQAPSQSSPLNDGSEKIQKEIARTETQQNPTPDRPRPRTLKQVAQQDHLPGLESQLNAGAHHRLNSSLDVRATPFGDYDRALIYAVQARWDSLLEQQGFVGDRTGKVSIVFKLEYDGTVRDVQVTSNNVGNLLSYDCQAAIEDAAPFGKWPDEMRQVIGENYREVTFTFVYY